MREQKKFGEKIKKSIEKFLFLSKAKLKKKNMLGCHHPTGSARNMWVKNLF